ncbi:suppressor of fused domain protein [Gandjariella thermophila]|uniref:Antitoxin YqcF n=1 Tax=Gandjariella thermophila TaxID=1931992 RepID=A0A4D4JF32_9PSEU|nr:suppressor of fused domain protein [Gandjariella thermophila]GDY34022.1 antitoxin YqcF [Gandjariella thermophila]
MSTVSESNRTIARTAAAAFGGRPTVTRYWDDNHHSSVDILTCADQPTEGVNSYATLGLSDTPLTRDGAQFPVRVELVGACANNVDFFPNALSTAAFYVINDHLFCQPGTIFPRVIEMYDPDITMKHLMFVSPFIWGDAPHTLELPDKTVAWLLAVPIAEEERRYAETHGAEALEDLFEQAQIDIFDIDRDPVTT